MSKKKTGGTKDAAQSTATTKKHKANRAARIARRLARGPHCPMKRKASTGAAEGKAWFTLVRQARVELA